MVKLTRVVAKIIEFNIGRDSYEITIIGRKLIKMVWRGIEVPDHNIGSHHGALIVACDYYDKKTILSSEGSL